MKRLALLLLTVAACFVFAGATASYRVHRAEGAIHEADDVSGRAFRLRERRLPSPPRAPSRGRPARRPSLAPPPPPNSPVSPPRPSARPPARPARPARPSAAAAALQLLARKERTLSWKNNLIHEKTAEVHKRDALLAEQQRALGEKDRTLKYKEGLVHDAVKNSHKNDAALSEQLKVIGSQERTLEWKNELIAEKTKELANKEAELAARSEMLARKQRTLEWKQNLIREKVADSTAKHAEVQRAKKQLFETQHIHHLSDQQLHAKLIKVLATLQAHLTREARHEHVVEASKNHMKEAIGAHAKAMKKLIGSDKGGELEKATVTLHNTVHEIINFVSEQIVGDHAKAEATLKSLTQEVLDELKSEIADDAKIAEDEKKMGENDAEYKAMMDEYKEEEHKPSQDEGAVKKMIEEYKKTVDSIRSPTGMKQSDVDDGYKVVDGVRDGTIDFEAGQEKMKAAMVAHSYPVDETATDLLGVFEQYLSEGEFMVQHEETRKHLDRWTKGEISDQEVMLEIERVSPGMLSQVN